MKDYDYITFDFGKVIIEYKNRKKFFYKLVDGKKVDLTPDEIKKLEEIKKEKLTPNY